MTKQEEPTEENTDPRGPQRSEQRKDPHPEQRFTDDEDPDKLTRRKRQAEQDEFYIPPEFIPDGWSVEWKRFSYAGKEDNGHIMGLEMDGWRAAKPKDFPMLVGKSYKGATIDLKDLRLYIRPQRLTAEAHYEHRVRSSEQVKDKMKELGLAKEGELPRVDGTGKSLVSVKASWEKPIVREEI